MKRQVLDILKAKFLVEGDASKNWRFIVFTSVLAIIMIASAHNADHKVHEIARLNEQVKKLRSEFVHTRAKLQTLKLESYVTQRVKSQGLVPSTEPPQKIMVKSSE